MQPTYTSLSSAGTTPWKLTNWQSMAPQQISFAVLSTGGSSGSITFTLEDPTGVFPSPNANGGITSPSSTYQAALTSFTLASISTGQSNQFIAVPSSLLPFAAWQGVLNTVGGKVTFVMMQQGIG